MRRRSFLAGILAAASAPAFVRPTSLMPIWTPRFADEILLPAWFDRAIGDDRTAISFAYRVERAELQPGRIVHWEPHEISLVSVPHDRSAAFRFDGPGTVRGVFRGGRS